MTPPRLHDYQHRAVDHLHRHPRSALFLDMGLGKTASVLSALTPLHYPALVVAPKKVAELTWPAECRKWRPDISVAFAVGTPARRRKALEQRADLTVISRDNLGDLANVKPGHYRTVVLDELSGFKARSSRRWKAAHKLTAKAENVWGLTGTPSPNGYLDLWAEMALIDNGKRLGTAIGKFRDRYFTAGWQLPSGVVTKWHPRPGSHTRINELLADICLSMSAADYLTLPPTILNTVDVVLPPSARAVYDRLEEDLVIDLSLIYGPGTVHSAPGQAQLGNRLRQITAGFLYADDGLDATTELHDAKLEALQDIVDGTGSPVLVFYEYRWELEQIRQRFPEAETIDAPGVLDRWNDGKVPMLVAHPASAGHGLNLQHGGHTMVFLTLPWSLELYQQASARLNRQGQQHPVVIHHLIVPDTTDGVVLKALQAKENVQLALLQYLARA